MGDTPILDAAAAAAATPTWGPAASTPHLGMPRALLPSPGSPMASQFGFGSNEQADQSMESHEAEIIGGATVAMHKLSIQHGSLKTYLNKELDSLSAKKEFFDYLKRSFPEKDDQHYEHGMLEQILENDRAGSLPQCVHISALSFLPACSLKPPPGCDITDQLVGEIFQDGFITASEPLLVTQPAELALLSDEVETQAFYLGHAKGQARAVTILSILYYFMKNEYDLKAVHPKLYESILAIYVHSMKVNSKEEEALLNMKLSCRGSIRRANNIVEVVFMLVNLNRYGMNDSNGFVRRWRVSRVWSVNR